MIEAEYNELIEQFLSEVRQIKPYDEVEGDLLQLIERNARGLRRYYLDPERYKNVSPRILEAYLDSLHHTTMEALVLLIRRGQRRAAARN
jgi:hypothetical protein